MKTPDDELEELESQSMEVNSRLEELIKDLNEGFADFEKQVEFLELLKKSQLVLPVVFSQNIGEVIEDRSPGEIFENKQPVGFNINYIELS